MSRVGKRILNIPEGVEVTITKDNLVTVKGSLGEMQKKFPREFEITKENNQIKVVNNNNAKQARMMHGTINSLINGMLIGVKEGYKKELQIIGVGYNVKMNGNELIFSLGYSHKIEKTIPDNLKVELVKQTGLIISGIDKQAVGLFASQIKKLRKPEPYGGKGIRYKDEHIIRKAGKAAK